MYWVDQVSLRFRLVVRLDQFVGTSIHCIKTPLELAIFNHCCFVLLLVLIFGVVLCVDPLHCSLFCCFALFFFALLMLSIHCIASNVVGQSCYQFIMLLVYCVVFVIASSSYCCMFIALLFLLLVRHFVASLLHCCYYHQFIKLFVLLLVCCVARPSIGSLRCYPIIVNLVVCSLCC